MDGAPPQPPPHSEKPNTTQGEYRKASDLPPGNYDIFVIPPHSAGSGFLYLPSLQCHRNSFIAGSLTTLLGVMLFQIVYPTMKAWYATVLISGNGSGSIILLALAACLVGWAFGVSQAEQGTTKSSRRGRGGFRPGSSDDSAHNQFQPGANYSKGADSENGRSGGQNPGGRFGDGSGFSSGPRPSAQNGDGGSFKSNAAGNEEWDRAREETKRKEELRKKMEEYKKKREAEQREKQRQREREAMEKELRERREQLEKEIAAAKEAAAKEAKEKAEKEAAEAKEKAEREAAEKEAAAKETAKKEADAKFAALKEAAAKRYAEKKAMDAAVKTPSPKQPSSASPKRPPFPTARTTADDDDAYSFRPYDRPRRPYGTSATSVDSESSYAPSQSTARTTPPPSHSGPYSTKDPDKIVIRGVYVFNNAFPRTPIAQLMSGQGMVTEGLILRITTEGMFIDDDIRGVAQREWDAKAWTMKTVESGEMRGLHVLRASIRDQEGKRYVFVLPEAEAWKVTAGLQRLRKGSQVRGLSVSNMPASECKTLLGNLGFV